MTVKLVTDYMGGDHGVGITVSAAVHFLATHEDVETLLVGQPNAIAAQLKRFHATANPRVHVVLTSEVVSMDDPIEVTLHKKRDSSIRVVINRFREGATQACVSAGNTGVLMIVSRYVLRTLDGIDRPTIATAIPDEKGAGTTILDLSANTGRESEHLPQFAQMTSAMVSVVEQKPRLTVGSLNIDEEVTKGNEVVKQAGELLRASGLNFFGSAEGNDIFENMTDVVVYDGFVGNVTLKSTEELVKIIGKMLRQESSRSWLTKLLAVVALPVLTCFRRCVDRRRYNGAAPLGLRGLVIKGHGSVDAYAFEWAIKRAYDVTADGMITRITQASESHYDAAGAASVSISTPAADVA